MSGVWLTSDLHLGHRFVAGLRGFEDEVIDGEVSCSAVEQHDNEICFRWARMVQPDDVIWVLGDISAGGVAAQEEALRRIAKLPGRKRLVSGNHDSCHPMYLPKATAWLRAYLEVFEWVGSQAKVKIDGRTLMLSHFPYTHDRGTPRYVEWRARDEGLWLAHGHTHEKTVWAAERPNEYHVGVDAHNMRPVSLGQLGLFMRTSMNA